MSRALFLNQFGCLPGANPKIFTQKGILFIIISYTKYIEQTMSLTAIFLWKTFVAERKKPQFKPKKHEQHVSQNLTKSWLYIILEYIKQQFYKVANFTKCQFSLLLLFYDLLAGSF